MNPDSRDIAYPENRRSTYRRWERGVLLSGQASADRTSVAGLFCIILAANSLIFGMYRWAVTGDDY